MKQFYCPTRIVTGPAGQALAQLHPKRLLLVADPYFVKTGQAQAVLKDAGAEQTFLFSDISPDPTVELAARGTGALKKFGPDTVAALGGGSAIDCAKAMVYFSGLAVKFAAIATTSGSGSEVTDFSVLTHDGVKHPLVDDKLRPDMAILDEAFLQKLPPKLIADTGFDLLSHALEAYTATGAGTLTDALAGSAFCTGLAHLESSYRGDCSVRLALHQASCMAGMAFSGAGLGLCHAISHSLGGLFHISHGRLNAILLPAVMEQNARAAGKKYAALARTAGLCGASDTLAFKNLKNALIRLRKKLELPESLQQAGVDLYALAQKKEELIRRVLEDPCAATNPVPVTAELVGLVLQEVQGIG